jgi:hypothetical protein
MYVKLNYNDNVQWKDVLNTLRIILTYNITSIADLTTNTAANTEYITNVDSTARNSLDISGTTTSEIYRTTAPGVGYTTGTNSPWSWNWGLSTATPSYNSSFNYGPEMVFQRQLSTNSAIKYYVRLRYDGTNFTMGCFSNGPANFTGSNQSTVPVLSNGEDRIIGYNMSSLTSFFFYMTPTSIMISGKGPTGATLYSTTGWLTTATRPLTGLTTTASTVSSSTNIASVAPDGSRISFSSIGLDTSVSTAAGTYYYLRTLGSATLGNNYSIASNLYNLHTGNYITRVAAAGTVSMNIDGYLPHNPNASNQTTAHFGPAFVSEYTPYDATAIGTNNYIPVMYSGGYTYHSSGGYGSPKSWFGMSAQDFLWADAYHTAQAYKLLSIQYPTPTTNVGSSTSWTVASGVPCYIGNDFRTIERAPLGDANYGYITITGSITTNQLTVTSTSTSFGSAPTITTGMSITAAPTVGLPAGLAILSGSTSPWTLNQSLGTTTGSQTFYLTRATDVPMTPALSDQPAFKFSDSAINGSYGLFPLVWSLSQYNTAGGKLSPALAGFMLYNGEYYPDDYFTTGGTTYALWPMADGFTRRLGIAVPKS